MQKNLKNKVFDGTSVVDWSNSLHFFFPSLFLSTKFAICKTKEIMHFHLPAILWKEINICEGSWSTPGFDLWIIISLELSGVDAAFYLGCCFWLYFFLRYGRSFHPFKKVEIKTSWIMLRVRNKLSFSRSKFSHLLQLFVVFGSSELHQVVSMLVSFWQVDFGILVENLWNRKCPIYSSTSFSPYLAYI